MLLISRKIGEEIKIGDDITIIIVNSIGQVKLGIEAPIEIPVHRREIYDRIQQEKKELGI